jgi:UPF0755 protein
MSRTTKEINKITGFIISISTRLIILALMILILHEGITRGYEFGHELFYNTAVESPPGHDIQVTIEEGTSVAKAAELLKNEKLIINKYSFVIQAKFFEYTVNPGTYTINTSMTSKEILQMLNEETEETKEEKE